MPRQRFNPIPICVPARVSNDATTQAGRSEHCKEDNYDDVESGPNVPPNMMYTETSLDFICSTEVEPIQRIILKPKSNSKPYKRNNQNIVCFGFPTGENGRAFCSRVKTLVHHLLRDVHVKWIIFKKKISLFLTYEKNKKAKSGTMERC